MKKYIKKPIEIEALQWTGVNQREMFNFLENKPDQYMTAFGDNFRIDHSKVDGGLVIKTLEGEHIASIGDFIIKGVKGEFYPCKPDIFEFTYNESSLPSPSLPSDEEKKKLVINKILHDLPIREVRGDMSPNEWYGWFEEVYDKAFSIASTRIAEMEMEVKRLRFMIDNGLGSKDIQNDI